ncbi:MAG: alpha/beta fold hydrolase [Bacteroidales bacterium]|nr:alpha/beta fold hydrolase [Candidatus Latescibacterota bacterium]
MSNQLENINQAIWELKQMIEAEPERRSLRRDLLRFFFESRQHIEKRGGIPEEDRSFLMLQERESISCVLLHGAGGTPAEMQPFAEHLFSQGYSVYGVRLPLDPKTADTGFGEYIRSRFPGEKGKQTVQKIRSSNSWSECLSHSQIVLETVLGYSPTAYLIGFSFGATLALELALRYPLKGTVLISPALVPASNRRYMLFKFWKKIFPSLVKNMAPVRSTMLEFIDNVRTGLKEVPEPMLVIQSADDPVISARGFQILRRVSTHPGSRFVLLENGGHVIIKGDRSPKVFDICSSFIRDI